MRRSNWSNNLIKILYVIIALTSFLLIREYTYTHSKYVSNTEDSSYVESYEQENSSFYELEGEDDFQ